MCVVAGAGTLGLPYGIKEGGWVSISFFILTTFVSIYTSKLLIECLYYKQGERLSQFADIGEASFGKSGRYFANFFSASVSLSSPCIYILLTGNNVFAVLKQTLNRDILTEQYWIAIAGVVVLVPFALAKTLKEVALLGVFGAFTTLFVVLTVAIKGGIDFPGDPSTYVPIKVVNWDGLSNSFAIIAFAYGGSVVYPHVESTMKNPKAWNKVVVFAVMTVSAMYLLIAITGAFYYGENVKNIILNSIPASAASITVYILITLHVVVAAPIFLCSFALEQEKVLKIDTKHMSASREFIFRVLFRTFLVVVLTLIAMFVPYFDVLTGVAGAVANCMTVLLIPVVCHYKLYGWRHRSFLEHVLAVVIIFMSIFGLVMGTYSSIVNGIASENRKRAAEAAKV